MPPMEVPVSERKLAVASCRLPIIIPPTDDNIDSIVPQLMINKRPAAFMWHGAERQYKTHGESHIKYQNVLKAFLSRNADL